MNSNSKELAAAYLQSLASLCVAEELERADKDDERRLKKRKVIDLKAKAFSEAFGVNGNCDRWWLLEQRKISTDDAKALLIDLSFANPFAPYQLEYREKDLLSAAKKVGEKLGLSVEVIDGIWKTRQEVLDSHSEISWGKILMFAVGGAAALAASGYLAAPALAAYLGGGAGLAGAAAAAHGLALLGGGTLAMGGMGMAGGLWLVTGAGAAAGLALGGGASLLLQIGSGAAKVELLKLQISFKEITLSGQIDRAKAQASISKLADEKNKLKEKLNEERSLNDKNSQRIKEIEKILETMDKSINWMRKAA